jgi:hypothetical protein
MTAGSQVYRLECFTGDVPVGATAEGLFNWTSGDTMNPETQNNLIKPTKQVF